MKIVPSHAKTVKKASPKAGGKLVTVVTAIPTKAKRSLQGRINPLLPINQVIVNYTPDKVTNLETSDEEENASASEIEAENENISNLALRTNVPLVSSRNQAFSIIESDTTIGMPGRNVILGKTKNRQALYGADQVAVVLFKAGKGDAALRGESKRNWRKTKSQKLTLAQMSKAGIGLRQSRGYLRMPGVNLKAIPEYCLLAADIVAHICDILKKECQMENVDGLFQHAIR